MGGIELRNLKVLNNVCLMKLWWKIINKSNDLWCSIVNRKYLKMGNDDLTRYRGSDSSLWKEFIKNIPKLLESGSWSVKDGKNINAWKNNWWGKSLVWITLRSLFQTIFVESGDGLFFKAGCSRSGLISSSRAYILAWGKKLEFFVL